MGKTFNYILKLLLILILPYTVYNQKIGKRSSYSIPLISLGVSTDKNNLDYKKIRIEINNTKEYAIITRLNDYHYKVKRNNTEKTTYAERLKSPFTLTNFEVQQVNRVIKSFIATLETFEHDLQKKRWDKCLYLDAFLPRFLKGFYYFSCTAFNSNETLPPSAKVSDEMYDVSLRSKKSERRVRKWLDKKDHVIKLRIATRELIYQLKHWQKKELNVPKRKVGIEYNKNLRESYNLFIKAYFNLL